MSDQHVLKMIAYNGFNQTLLEGTLMECRARAKRRIAWYKDKIGGTVSQLQVGMEWECCPPDEAVLIGDWDGYLKIVECVNGEEDTKRTRRTGRRSPCVGGRALGTVGSSVV